MSGDNGVLGGWHFKELSTGYFESFLGVLRKYDVTVRL